MSEKQKTELYLKVPYHILNIKGLSPAEKFLLAHIYSFGEKGCWQSNQTLAKMFMVTPCAISRWLKKISKFVYIKCPKSYYRTIWSKSHPEVQAAVYLLYRGHKVLKPDKNSRLDYSKIAQQPTQKCVSDCSKSVFRLKQKCYTTINTTKKEININTTATPSPPPCKGAPALLESNRQQAPSNIEGFKHTFGKSKTWQPLSPEEFEARRAAQIRALMAVSPASQSPPLRGHPESPSPCHSDSERSEEEESGYRRKNNRRKPDVSSGIPSDGLNMTRKKRVGRHGARRKRRMRSI